mmetsp:Transcript_58725/g.113278  ORF Transcript_58725/g.113278 Transcript_58725/m.113278 type:complete len:118 (-) Transcript_58725:84-437(-)
MFVKFRPLSAVSLHVGTSSNCEEVELGGELDDAAEKVPLHSVNNGPLKEGGGVCRPRDFRGILTGWEGRGGTNSGLCTGCIAAGPVSSFLGIPAAASAEAGPGMALHCRSPAKAAHM